jgi:alkylated DNA repair dioxygenase AlkB
MENLLPFEGQVYYYGKCFESPEELMSRLLLETPWKPDEVIIMGRKITTKRQMAWYGEGNYSYSGIKRNPLPWTELLLELKTAAEFHTGETFNSCLINLYSNGTEGVGWHSDNEKELQNQGAIASITFGAERKFVFQHKETKEKREIYLEAGSLLIMKGETQKFWKHALPPMRKIKSPRINLTFRTVLNGGGS